MGTAQWAAGGPGRGLEVLWEPAECQGPWAEVEGLPWDSDPSPRLGTGADPVCAQPASPLSSPQAPLRGPVRAWTKEATHEDLSSRRADQLISGAQMEKPASVERLRVGNDFFLEICGLRGEAEDSPGCS